VSREKHGPVPAALPLLAFATGLAFAPADVSAARDALLLFLAAALLVALRRTREAMIVLALTGGMALALHAATERRGDLAALAGLQADRFVVIEAPLDHDWALRPGGYVLRVPSFRANGIEVTQPLVIASHFEPPPIGMAATVRAEAFLRINDRRQFVASVKSPRLLAYRGRLAWWRPAAWNRALINRLRPFAADHATEVALVEAIALGRGERLDDTVRDGYRRGGTYHLLVFSGLQIAFAAGAIALLLRWLHAPRLSDWSLLAFALLIPLFIGPTPAVSRAAIAIGLYALARILRRPTTAQNLWCVAALVRLAFAPDDLTEAAFQLTYAGAGALLFVSPQFLRVRRLGYAVVAELAITPLALFHFHQYALGGSILTLLLLPLLMTMLGVAALTCAIPCRPLLAVMGALHHVCETLNAFAGDTLHLSGFFAAPPHWSLALAAAVSLLAIASLKRWRAAVIFIALLLPTGAAIARYLVNHTVASPRLTMLDVGQGDSILVRDGPGVLLVDGGGRNDAPRFGESTLVPLLVDRGVRRVDVLVLTHVHPDHCGGLPAVVRRLDVGEVWLSPRRFRGECAQRLLEAITARAVPIRLIRAEENPRPVQLGGLRIAALTADRTFKHGTENNASVVLRVAAGGRTILLTGDIEREAEGFLATTHDLHADILKVAHHGSRTSTSEPLLDSVRPRLALISCGRGNLFGHPHASVLAALAAHGVRTWRTDRAGSIDVEVDHAHIFVHFEFDTSRQAVLE
jgi:competence protein ComEC